MTLSPSDDFGIRGEPGRAYELAERCSVPGCPNRSAHGHHMWSRSHLRGQPYEWVRLPDGTVVGNRTGLCVDHHDEVTSPIGGHRARITFRAGLFWWTPLPEEELGWTGLGPLEPQPPGVSAQERPSQPASTNGEVCPTCGKPRHTRPHTPSPRRKSKTWTLEVPDDIEDGGEILDIWVDDLAVLLGFSDERSRLRRYHVLATVLAWSAVNRDLFVADLKEAAEA